MEGEIFKILLADDEGIVTDSLQFIINKNFGDTCQCKVAKNGRQAIELAESFRPDILFLDIHMPNLNGLHAMEEIRAQNKRVKVIFLTAYDNVEYTKEALRLSASDYLTKPINRQVIVDRINQLMGVIRQERQKRNEELLAKEKMAAMLPVIENGFVSSLIMQADEDNATKHYRNLLNLQEDFGMIAVLSWRNNATEQEDPLAVELHAYEQFEKISALVKMHLKGFVSSVMGNQLICAIPCATAQQSYEGRVQFTQQARGLLQALHRVLPATFKIGCGAPRKWENMFDSYQEALNALRHGKGSISHVADFMAPDTRKKQRQMMEQELLKAVARGIEYEVHREASLYANWERKNPNATLEEQRLQAVCLLLMARRTVQEQGGTLPAECQATHKLMQAHCEEGLYATFVEAMVALTQAVVIQKEESSGVIAQAQAYIQQNFRKDLALEEVAKQVGISAYYFSKLFKEEVGTNFIDYLTAVRIETAKRLLADSQMSIKQICLEAGYANPNYFSRIFKKSVGITPTEFRDQLYTKENAPS